MKPAWNLSGHYCPTCGDRMILNNAGHECSGLNCNYSGPLPGVEIADDQLIKTEEITIGENMSWDIYIKREVREEVRNLTYNNSKILTELGLHPKGKEELTGAEWLALFKASKIRLKLPFETERLKEYGPTNGWGGVQDVENFIDEAIQKLSNLEDYEIEDCKLVWR